VTIGNAFDAFVVVRCGAPPCSRCHIDGVTAEYSSIQGKCAREVDRHRESNIKDYRHRIRAKVPSAPGGDEEAGPGTVTAANQTFCDIVCSIPICLCTLDEGPRYGWSSRQYRQGRYGRRAQPPGRRAHRPHSVAQPLSPVSKVAYTGRENARDKILDCDSSRSRSKQWRGHAGRRARLCGAYCRTSSRLRQLRGAAEQQVAEVIPDRPSTGAFSRRWDELELSVRSAKAVSRYDNIGL